MTSPIRELQRVLDPRLEWLHDKVIGPSSNQALYNMLGVVWYVHSGGATIRTARGIWDVEPGQWIFLYPGHRFQGFKKGTRIWSIGYRFNRPRGTAWYVGPDVLVLRGCAALEQATRRMLRIVETATGLSPLGWVSLPGLACSLPEWMRLDAAFRMWLAAAIDTVGAHPEVTLVPFTHDDERIRTTLALLASDPWSSASEPEALARAVHLSRRRLEQLFASEVGHGLADERATRRMGVACDLLMRQDMQVKQVALQLGFPRSSTFSAWFRRHAGVSPVRFRRDGMRGG
jgi:AraC-like DNA-binding protein